MRDTSAYRQQLQALLPPGAAWPRDEDAVLTRLLDALAAGLAAGDGRARALIEEADPLTALELLPDWERAVGLPDPCSPISDTIRERQLAVARKIAGIGGQSRPFFVQLAALLGLEVEIEEHPPFSTASEVDRPLFGSADWPHAFTVRALPPSEASGDPAPLRSAWLTTASGVDERIRSFGSEDLECVVARARPAHAQVIFAYPEDPEPMLWFDFTLNMEIQ